MAPPLLSYEQLGLIQGSGWLFRGLDLHVGARDRLALIGRNGAGKTTLLKLIGGQIEADEGKRSIVAGTNVVMLEQDPDLSGFATLRDFAVAGDRAPATHEVEAIADQLGIDLNREASTASGGERRRAAICRALASDPDILLLDEPTNHLDLEMRHALTKALAEYDGSLVLVSHDRALLRTACDEFALVADGRVEPFDGDIDDYLAWLAARRQAHAAASVDADQAADKVARKEARAAAAADRQARLARRRPLIREAEQLERQLAAWHEEKGSIDKQLADPSFYESPDPDQLKGLALRQTEVTRLIGEAEHRWLEVQAELEDIGEI